MQVSTEQFSTRPHSHSVRVDRSGRIVLPADVRARLHIQPGQELIVQEAGQHLTVKTFEQVLTEIQDYFADLAPPGVLLSEELIKDRRAEAAREHAELDRLADSHE